MYVGSIISRAPHSEYPSHPNQYTHSTQKPLLSHRRLRHRHRNRISCVVVLCFCVCSSSLMCSTITFCFSLVEITFCTNVSVCYFVPHARTRRSTGLCCVRERERASELCSCSTVCYVVVIVDALSVRCSEMCLENLDRTQIRTQTQSTMDRVYALFCLCVCIGEQRAVFVNNIMEQYC